MNSDDDPLHKAKKAELPLFWEFHENLPYSSSGQLWAVPFQIGLLYLKVDLWVSLLLSPIHTGYSHYPDKASTVTHLEDKAIELLESVKDV